MFSFGQKCFDRGFGVGDLFLDGEWMSLCEPVGMSLCVVGELVSFCDGLLKELFVDRVMEILTDDK